HAMVITLADAEQMRKALQEYLTKSKREVAKAVPPDLIDELEGSISDPWIDPTGHVRMGTWLLEARNGAPALTFRPLPPGSYQYMARLERKGETWRVASFVFKPIRVRQ